MKVKIFDGGSVRAVLAQCLREGYRPATLSEVMQLRKEGKIPNQWYDCATIGRYAANGARYFEDASVYELEHIEEVYEQGGRVLFLDINHDGLLGVSNLFINGRFVGVAPEAQDE